QTGGRHRCLHSRVQRAGQKAAVHPRPVAEHLHQSGGHRDSGLGNEEPQGPTAGLAWPFERNGTQSGRHLQLPEL
ncbi:hypothetical protein KR018_008138, partial [Drosophila ironensis]